jgi:hypothetical protein
MVAVAVETGTKKVFAVALEWPGWARAARDEAAAVETLAGYAGRYAVVAAAAGLALPAVTAESFEVVAHWKGSGNTDFGVPHAIADEDRAALGVAEARRQVALLRAAWQLLDAEAAKAPADLRKGPRGGGRDRDPMMAHVLSAEAVYAKKIGITHPEPALGDTAAIESLRAAVAEVLGRRAGAVAEGAKGWPPRYAARRFIWHVLDHLWEMQDRAE